jgi:hypothetical protein
MLAPLPSAIEITSQRGISCVSAIEGDVDEDAETRRRLEAELFRRIAESDIVIDVVSIDEEGAFFVVDTRRLDDLRLMLARLNLALRVRPNCTRISVFDRFACPARVPLMMARIVQALTDAGVSIVHCATSAAEVEVIVADRCALLAEGTLRALAA